MMNNLQKVIAAIVAITMVSGAFLVLVPSAGLSTQVESLEYPDQIAMYAEADLREQKVTDVSTSLVLSEEVSTEAVLLNNTPLNTTQSYVTSKVVWNDTADAWESVFTEINITKRGEGSYCEVWVADDCSFYNASDIRNTRIEILDSQIEYIIDEFDNNTYQIMTDIFSDAPALNGSVIDISYWQYVFNNDSLTTDNVTDMLFPTNDSGKLMIVIFNIVDENWYDGVNYSSYTVGYYSSTISTMYDRNIINLDCYDWVNRTGVQSDIPGSGHYSYVYESTVAHEYQHLLHDYVDPEEELWINEGLSMMAEYLCGYGISYAHIAYFLDWPDNSLTVWGDQTWIDSDMILNDYGAVALFDLYLYDHYGGTAMLQALFNSELQGIDGLNDALLDMGYNRLNFDTIYRNWRLANLFTFMDWEIDNPLYTYDPALITLDDVDEYLGIGSQIYLQYVEAGDSYDRYYNGYGYYLEAYGTDYFCIYDLNNISEFFTIEESKFVFDGDDDTMSKWIYYSVTGDYGCWYSGSGLNMADLLLTQTVNLTTPAEEGKYLHSLTITTYWDLENLWDYGFVQVSTDGGETWTSLNDTGEYCTEKISPTGYDAIGDYLPGLTNTSNEVVNVTFDLSAYDGQEILIGYRYMTDWAYTEEGWYIFNVNVDGVDVDLDSLVADPSPEADYMVTLVVETDTGYMIIDVPSLDVTEVAQKLLGSIGGVDEMYLLVSTDNGPVDYEFDVVERGTTPYD